MQITTNHPHFDNLLLTSDGTRQVVRSKASGLLYATMQEDGRIVARVCYPDGSISRNSVDASGADVWDCLDAIYALR